MCFLREFVFVLSGASVTFLVTVTEYPRQANNERNGLFLAHILRVQSIMVGKDDTWGSWIPCIQSQEEEIDPFEVLQLLRKRYSGIPDTTDFT